jgi:hypothetical protein
MRVLAVKIVQYFGTRFRASKGVIKRFTGADSVRKPFLPFKQIYTFRSLASQSEAG